MNPDQSSWLVRALDRIFQKKVIVNCAQQPYLHRWYVFRSERLGLFIHKFVRSDEDRALHDHPWPFIVIPLWGGYIEHSDRPLTNWEKDCVHENAATHRVSLDDLSHALVQRLPVVRRIRPLISTRYRSTTYRHRVELIEERSSWSIFIRFTKIRDWGFWPKSGFIQWNKWWQENKCE